MDRDAVANLCARVKDDVWEKANVVAYLAVTSDVIPSFQNGARADRHSSSDYAAWPYVRGGVDSR
jgi:hypothetical protein